MAWVEALETAKEFALSDWEIYVENSVRLNEKVSQSTLKWSMNKWQRVARLFRLKLTIINTLKVDVSSYPPRDFTSCLIYFLLWSRRGFCSLKAVESIVSCFWLFVRRFLLSQSDGKHRRNYDDLQRIEIETAKLSQQTCNSKSIRQWFSRRNYYLRIRAESSREPLLCVEWKLFELRVAKAWKVQSVSESFSDF